MKTGRMMIEHRGERPVVPESAYVAPSAVLCGAVVLGERARVLHGAVLTAENGTIRTGPHSHAPQRGQRWPKNASHRARPAQIIAPTPKIT